MPKETIGKTIAVAVAVCVVCSVFVSTAAVCLKDRQGENRTLEKNKNILLAAGLIEEGQAVSRNKVYELFQQIEPRVIDVTTGEFLDHVLPEHIDERKADKDPKQSKQIQNDLAGIKQRAEQRLVYFYPKGGPVERIVLPMHGKGLWSTMYGFLALDSDMTTIKSFAFYQHGETPGLGGEIDNPRWKDSWVDKKAFDDAWEPRIEVIKGIADPDAVYDVDGLSGATLTARGVHNLVRFWLGDEGYGPFLKKLREGDTDG